MLAQTISCRMDGMIAEKVTVEAELLPGFSSFIIVGLAGVPVLESRDRIRAALSSLNLRLPPGKILVNLCPGDLKKGGTHWDLPIAISLLASMGVIPSKRVANAAFLGELALDGSCRAIPGALAMVLALKEQGVREFYLPIRNAEECSGIPKIQVYSCRHLQNLVDHFQNQKEIFPNIVKGEERISDNTEKHDFSEIQGQRVLKRILTIAALGRHSVLLCGAPGQGKSMALERFSDLLPDLHLEELLETRKYYSISGASFEESGRIPYRSPHFTITRAGLIGGGKPPLPGEVTLAHHGILVLDELPLFSKECLNSLRMPLDQKKISLVRGNRNWIFPADFQLLAAMNPCPCGFYGSSVHECLCSDREREKYLHRIPLPLIDRIEIIYEIPWKEESSSMRKPIESEGTWEMKAKIRSAIKDSEISLACSKDGQKVLEDLCSHFPISRRGQKNLMRVAKTICRLDHQTRIDGSTLLEAFQYTKSRYKYWKIF
ncbi:YifB family Mg chelatase-like AAA ATPase [Peptoniphilaceae bacterium SGI.137]